MEVNELQTVAHVALVELFRFWDAFALEYFGADANMEEVMKQVKIYAGLKTIMIERDTHCPMPQFRAMLEGTIY